MPEEIELKKPKEYFIDKPEELNGDFSELKHFLNNFYLILKFREGLSQGSVEEQKLGQSIEKAIEETGFNLEEFGELTGALDLLEQHFNKVAENDSERDGIFGGLEILRLDIDKLILPLYKKLREMGVSHDVLAHGQI